MTGAAEIVWDGAGKKGINGVMNRDTAHTDGSVTFYFDDGYDPYVDGCVLGETIDDLQVKGVYRDGSPVNLNPCFVNDDPDNPLDAEFSTRKSGWYYVWLPGETDAPRGLEDGLRAANRLQDITMGNGR